MSGAMTAKNKQEIRICGCGELNPMHRGYCTNCVKKLKVRYDELLDAYAALQEEADDFNDADADKADEKLKLMKAKAEQYEIKLTDAQMLGVMEKHVKLADSDENRALAEKRVLVQALKKEQSILLFKQEIEEEDFEKQKEWLDSRAKEVGTKKKD